MGAGSHTEFKFTIMNKNSLVNTIYSIKNVNSVKGVKKCADYWKELKKKQV